MKITPLIASLLAMPTAVIPMAMLFSTAAWGDNPSVDNSSIEEITVTARKTEESQQSVPVSVAALSAKDLEYAAVLDIEDLSSSVTGLTVVPSAQGQQVTFAIRAAKEDNGTSNKVTAYIDDVPVQYTNSVANMMYDLSSVEVLKGPQGTLFGSNSTGGAIVFRPNKPTDEFGGYGELGVGNYDRHQFQGMLNLPVNDMIQMRLAGEVVRRDGFIKNLTPGPSPSRLDDDRHESLRYSLRIKPSAEFSNDIVVDYFHKNQQPDQLIPVAFRPDPPGFINWTGPAALGGAGLSLIPLKDYTVSLGSTAPNNCGSAGNCTPTFDKGTDWGVADTAAYDLNDRATIKNTLSYRNDKADTYENIAGTSITNINGRNVRAATQWTEEMSLHLVSEDKRLRSLFGAYFQKQDNDQGQGYSLLWLPGLTVSNVAALVPGDSPIPLAINESFTRKFQTRALYGQASYDLTKELTVTFGLRYNWDDGKYTAQPHASSGGNVQFNYSGDPHAGPCADYNLTPLPSYNLATCTGYLAERSNAPSYNFTVEDRFADKSLLYFAVRGGYITGGFNNDAPDRSHQTFAPEKVQDFEVGVKSDWTLWNRPIRTNIDAFYGKYSNMQTPQVGVNPNTGTSFIAVFNAASSTYYGADLEVKFKPFDHIDLGLNWTHIRAVYDNFCGPSPVTGEPCINLNGADIAQTPRNSVQASATFLWPIAPATGYLTSTLSYYWQSQTKSLDVPMIDTVTGENWTRFDTVPSFAVANFTTEWKAIFGSRVDANLWVKNLADRVYITYAYNEVLNFGKASDYIGAPRTVGLNVRYSF